MRSVVSFLALVVAVMACSSAEARFTTTFPAGEHVRATELVLIDSTGLVRGVAVAHGGGVEQVTVNPADPTALSVSWLGGMCDIRTTLRMETDGQRLTISASTDRESSCLLAGISRDVVIRLATPIDAGDVEFVSR